MRPLHRVLIVPQAVAGGDMTERVNVNSGDGCGDLSRAFDQTTVDLTATMGQIKENASVLAASSVELSAISMLHVAGAEETSVQISGVASVREQVSSNINTMVGAVESDSK